MPSQPTVTQIRLNNIIACLGIALDTLETISKTIETPFLQVILITTRSLLSSVQIVRTNKDHCTRMMEQIYELLYAIIHFHLNSDTDGELLSANLVDSLGKFTETLHKIHTFVEAQQEKSRIKQFFRQGELTTLLKDCTVGLEQALEVFKLQGVHLLGDVAAMQQYAQKTHDEVLELISALSEGQGSDSGSSISRIFAGSQESSNSLSLLPSEPKIFHGRDSEVSAILRLFSQETPRIAVLGPGGIGKTSLARAVLHHPEITARYGQARVFVPCDLASNSVQLAAIIAAHLGLKPGKDLTRPVVRHFSDSGPALLVLDNLETIWEPQESRGDLEQFLALLTGINDLALIITMRGAERPAKVAWTRPFLDPLKPLTLDAARKTFIDIVDEGHAIEDIDRILTLADNMPLAIDLIAHLVDYEGFDSVSHRWETERTSLLSDGHDKGSNLDLSISISLQSPRLASLPHSRDLLSLLSILPDGLSDVELLQSNVPLTNVLACKVALLRTSLAYTDAQGRLRTLLPIREYVQKNHPPPPFLVESLFRYFQEILAVYDKYQGTLASTELVPRIATNFSNIQNILVTGLNRDDPDLVNIIYSASHLDFYSRHAGHGRLDLMDKVSTVLPPSLDPGLQVYFITRLLGGSIYFPFPNAGRQVELGLTHLPNVADPDLKCAFYNIAAEYYRMRGNDTPKAMHLAEAGLSLAVSTGNTQKQSDLLTRMAWIQCKIEDYAAAQEHAFNSQRHAKISGNLLSEARGLRIECLCWHALGNYTRSIALSQRARDLLPLCGISGGSLEHSIMNLQAEVHEAKSEYLDARDIHVRILRTTSIDREPFQHAIALLNVAHIDVEIDAPGHDVERNVDIVDSLFTKTGRSTARTWCDVMRAAVHMRDGDLLAAKTLFRKSLDCFRGKDVQAVGYCLGKLGDVGQWGRADQTTSAWTVTFLVHGLKLKQKLEVHKALQYLADVYLADGDEETAISLLTAALGAFTQMDVHRHRAECMLRLGGIAKLRGDLARAVELWTAARPLFERSSQANQVALIDQRLVEIRTALSGHHARSLVDLSALHAPTTVSLGADVEPPVTTLSVATDLVVVQ